MAKVKKPKTKAPTGLTIARNGEKFLAQWKIKDADYGEGQQFQWKINDGKWQKKTIGKTTTYKTMSVDFDDYYPTDNKKKKLTSISVRVRGKRKDYKKTKKGKTYTYKPKWSDWTTKKYSLEAPDNPKKLTATLDSTLSNVCTFAWETTTSNTGKKPFRNIRYESIRVKNSNVSDGKKLKWSSSNAGWTAGTKSATSSITITEDSTLLTTAAYTRWVRVHSRGPAGANKWKYTKHVYSMPNQSQIKESGTGVKAAPSGGYICTVKWTSPTSTSKPIDKTVVQYCFATPDVDMQCPEGASWTDAATVRDTKGEDGVSFSVDTVVGYDQCMFVRVNNHHDTNVIYGAPYMTAVGPLTAPSDITVTTDDTLHTARIAATNNSAVLDSFLVVTYKTTEDPDGFKIGIIPHGATYVDVQCPAWTGIKAFGVYACVGSYEETPRGDGVDSYAVDELMVSTEETQGGTVPVAPSSVTLEQTARAGTVRVIFDWTWEDATAAEISWADHDDAWESTEEPETYIVSSLHASAWNISGLETGVTWYVRVRLMNGTGDDATYGAYSDIKSINLSSAPAIPILEVSGTGIITEDQEITASWVYVSTDGTAQASATVAEVADVDGGEYVLTTDTTAKTVKTYYAYDGENYNAVDLGVYELTADTTITAGKNYYERTGAGTAASPYVYTLSSPEDPTGYYEFTGQYNSPSGYYQLNYLPIATAETAQYVTINTGLLEWDVGETHLLVVKVVSASGQESQSWSDPVSVTVAEPLTATITQSSLVEQTITQDGESRTVNSLTAMPFTITVTGAGDGGVTTVIIERTQTYNIARPDESEKVGFEGETVALISQIGEGQITLDQGDPELLGFLDDEAPYTIIATVQDGLGQSAEARLDFEVHWTHQAVFPEAQVVSDQDELICYLTPIAPSGWATGDTCDIYRLSVDKPQLIYPNAVFGTKYVDPFPTIGEYGGHRFVYKTVNGDYITADNEIAWLDTDENEGDYIVSEYNVIDFGTDRVRLMYNVDLTNTWKKDFKETKYLGGSVQGDWNPAVSRTASITSVAIAATDQDTIEAMRRLATYSGICHVRTKDGSSYAADVQVTESYRQDTSHKVVEFSLSVTRVDPETYDGMTYADWMEG